MKRTSQSWCFRELVACWSSLTVLLVTLMSRAVAAEGTAPRGMAVAQACVVCHGPDGQSTGAIPSLRGISTQKLRAAMLAYRTGERSGTVMNRLARGLDDADIEAVATYFSTRR
jgi:cytochrome subunit of sulfide dehydrogenase